MDGVTEHVLPTLTGNLYLSFWPRHLRLLRLIRAIRPDLIHAHFIAKYGFHLPFLGIHPCIVSAWGDDILILPKKSALIRIFTCHVLRYADAIYAVSEDIARHIKDDFHIPDDKVRYVPFGIDSNLFYPMVENRTPGREKIEVFSNRGYYPVYDTATLLRGFTLAYEKNPALRLTLKGDGPEENTVRELAQSLGISPVVTFKARTPYSDVPHDYHIADIFVTTSVSDGTPVSVLEAMASGLPCIATSVGGIPEWITDGENGFLIPLRSPEKLAEKILLLSQDIQRSRTFGANARSTILKKGEWHSIMAQVEKEYEELIRTYRRKES